MANFLRASLKYCLSVEIHFMLCALFVSAAIAVGQAWFAAPFIQNRNTIEGRVQTRDHQPISEVRVFLQNDSYSEIAATFTDGSGRFRFLNLMSGVYYVQIEPGALNFERQSQRVEAVAFTQRQSGGGEVFRVDFVVKPKETTTSSGEYASDKGVLFHQPVPDEARKEYVNALRSLDKNDFGKAAAFLAHAIEIYPDYYEALELIGTEYVKREQYKSALPFLSHAVEVNKDGWRAFYSLGVAEYELNQHDAALQSLRRAVELNPGSPNAVMRLGIALAQNAATRMEAIQAFQKVIDLAKDRVPTAYFYLGALYAKDEQYRKAADAFETFLRIYPKAGERDKIKEMIAEYRQKAKAQSNK